MKRRKNTNPLRKVVSDGHGLRRCNCIFNNQLQTTWWELTLECGHTVERAPRYPKQVGVKTRGFGALHHPRDRAEAYPPPKRCRCEHCAYEARKKAETSDD